MTLSEYIDFWMISWDYMKGSRKDFWLGLPKATWNYRKATLKDKEIR